VCSYRSLSEAIRLPVPPLIRYCLCPSFVRAVASRVAVGRRHYNVNGNEVKAGSTIKWEGQTDPFRVCSAHVAQC
jgi:hypothetical protein